MANNQEKYHRLYWVCFHSNRKYPAGVAFFNESKGDYRLKLDILCDEKNIYLKPVSVEDGMVKYRVESAKKGGQFRSEIGVGHSFLDEEFPICIELGPFERSLMLEAAV